MEEEKPKNKHTGIKVLLLLFALAIIAVAVFVVLNMNVELKSKDVMKEIFETIEVPQANLTEYIVYGTHLSIKGELATELSNVKNVKLVFEGLSGANKEINLNYERTSQGITFSTSELLNEGIDLETMNIDKYFMLIGVTSINRERQ